jgi:hypothetical protein
MDYILYPNSKLHKNCITLIVMRVELIEFTYKFMIKDID